MSSRSESVRVCVRIRPLSTKEIQDGHSYIVSARQTSGEVTLQNPETNDREPPKNFTFDAAIAPEARQMQVYKLSAEDIVDSVMKGFNGTIFAYGQTGAGKSHTMEGYADKPEEKGIIPNSFHHIFEQIASEESKQFMVYASYLEIYNEEIRDLLAQDPKNRLELKENLDTGVYVKDLTSRQVKGIAEIDAVLQQGKKNRSVGATLMNQTSSRSHSMFTITVEACTKEVGGDGKQHICVGKLNLVDLAGSERQTKTGATGDRMKEATKINLSLSALGNVISSLVDGKSQHIPYRDSKLTRLLQDSLGGNAKTVMIANVGPADYNYNETLSTLRYANRAKNIKNKPKINEDPKDARIREYHEKIKELREALAAQEKTLQSGEFFSSSLGFAGMEPQIVEKIIERTVIRREGVSEEEMQKLEEDAQREKKELKLRAQAEMKVLLAEQSRTIEEREKLEKELEFKAQKKNRLAKEKEVMIGQLKKLEKEMIIGGQVLDKAAKQEKELRDAQKKIEQQKKQEIMLARELAEKGDSSSLLEKQYATLQEEVDDKTKKLRSLWAKHKDVSADMEEMRVEFQAEKEDILETIRGLDRQLKLKQLLVKNFVRIDLVNSLEKQAKFDPETEEWTLTRANSDPTSLRPKRTSASRTSRRIESDFTCRNRLVDRANYRWRGENVIQLDLEMPERITKDFECGAGMDFYMNDPALGHGEDEEIMYDANITTKKDSKDLNERNDKSVFDKADTNAAASTKKALPRRPTSTR
uniref:Kinesin-like protein n=1 Tax=Albugo laibachii Nc14 TaxID=890382 RepID=F0WEU0_9STRA|nr:kinesinlike protein putative [Albugo laibachii Nc14]|eukprot:CCA19722.1 kinesinlike protein putative [Albugo laibachii Nc14]